MQTEHSFCTVHGACIGPRMVHTWNTPVLCIEIPVPYNMVRVWNMPVLCMEHTCIMHGIMHGTCMET